MRLTRVNHNEFMRRFFMGGLAILVGGWRTGPGAGAATPLSVRPFLDRHCVECHDADTKKGGLDLAALKFELSEPAGFAAWVGVLDRVAAGEMPPPKQKPPPARERAAFTNQLVIGIEAEDFHQHFADRSLVFNDDEAFHTYRGGNEQQRDSTNIGPDSDI